MNVSINNVESVIRAVLRLAQSECERLPKRTMITELTVEENLELFGLNHALFTKTMQWCMNLQ